MPLRERLEPALFSYVSRNVHYMEHWTHSNSLRLWTLYLFRDQMTPTKFDVDSLPHCSSGISFILHTPQMVADEDDTLVTITRASDRQVFRRKTK